MNLSIIRAAALLALAATLGACAPAATRSDAATREAVLEQRATQRWSYLINHQAEKAYDFLTPGYRNGTTRDKYAREMNARPIAWESVSFNKIECDAPDNCQVYLVVDYKVHLPGTGGTGTGFAPLRERWLQLGDQWYHLPRETSGDTIKATR